MYVNTHNKQQGTHLYEPEMALSPSTSRNFSLREPRTFCADRVKNSTPPQQRTRRYCTHTHTNKLILYEKKLTIDERKDLSEQEVRHENVDTEKSVLSASLLISH